MPIYNQFDEISPYVSIVIPAYNAGAYIDETLNSLEKQTLDNIEIICVDDGSVDDTLAIAEKHAVSDPRVRVLHQSNSGAGVARNAGLALATGMWLAFLDADDIYKLDFLEKMVKAAESCGAEIAVCDINCLIEKTGEVKPWENISPRAAGPFVKTSVCADYLFQLTSPVPFNKIFKTSFVREQRLQFQSLGNCNDVFFSCSALASSKTIALVHESLVTYRISEGTSIQDNLTKFPTMEKCLCVYKALDALENYCLERSLLNGGLGISLDAACVILAFGATTKALGNDDLLEQVFCAYQNALKNEWHVSKPQKSTGFEVRSKYELMVNSTAAQFAWVYKQAGQSRRGGKMRKALLGAKTALVIVQNKLHRKK